MFQTLKTKRPTTYAFSFITLFTEACSTQASRVGK